MTSSARRATLEVTVPPEDEAWKNWLSSNSQACAACARNTVSTFAYCRRMPCSAKKKNCLARRRCASSIEPETSSAKITAALVAGDGRLTSWRKRRSSLIRLSGSSSSLSAVFPWTAWRFTASFIVRRRSRRERAPRLSQPSRMYSGWSMVLMRFGFNSGSFSSSHSQSTISSIFSSTTKRISPSPVPPAWPCWSPSSRPGCSTSPGSPFPCPAPCCTWASERRKRECSRNLTGTATVRLGRVIRSAPARRSGRVSFTASRTFWLCRNQSRAPLEKRSYQGVSADMRIAIRRSSFLGEQRGHVVERFTRAVRVVAVFIDQALLDHGDLLPRVVIRTSRRGDESQDVAPALEKVLLDRVVQRSVRVEREFLAALVRAHRLAHYFLAEGELAGLGDADFLFHRAQEPLVGLALLVGDRVAHRAVVELRLDLVQILVEQLLRFLLEGHEERLVDVFLHPAVVEVLAHRNEEVDPLALLLAVDPDVGFDRILERDQHVHRGEAARLRLDDGVGERVDDEARRYAGEALVRALGADLRRLVGRDAFDVLGGVDAHFLDVVLVALLALGEAREHGEHRGDVQGVRVEVHLPERLRGRAELAIDARLFLVVQRVRHLDDDHAVEQRLVLRLLQELAELGEVGVRDDGLVEVDEREERHLDVLLLREREEEIQELALHFEDLDHLEQAAARGIHRARPRPGPRIAFVAEFGDLRKIDRADQVGDVRRRRVVRRVGAHPLASRFGDEDAVHRHAHEVAAVIVLQAACAVRAQLARDLDAVRLAELCAQRVRDEMQRRLVHRAAIDGVKRAFFGLAVSLEPALEQDHHARLAAGRGAEQQEQPPADFGARGGRLEVVDDARNRVVDPEELVLEELTAEAAAAAAGRGEALVESIGVQHVPDVLVAGARDALGVGREYGLEELGEHAAPVRGAMLLGEVDQRLHEVGVAVGVRPSLHHGLRNGAHSTPISE